MWPYKTDHNSRLVHHGFKPADFDLPPRWLTIGFPPHNGKTMPTVLFDDPEWLRKFCRKEVSGSVTSYWVELYRQARVVAIRAEHILAPKRYGQKTQFVIVADRNDVFERFILTPKGRDPKLPPLRKGSRIFECCTELRLSMVSEFADESFGFKRMGRCLRETFPSKSHKLSAERQYELFIEKDDQFNLAQVRHDAFL